MSRALLHTEHCQVDTLFLIGELVFLWYLYPKAKWAIVMIFHINHLQGAVAITQTSQHFRAAPKVLHNDRLIFMIDYVTPMTLMMPDPPESGLGQIFPRVCKRARHYDT